MKLILACVLFCFFTTVLSAPRRKVNILSLAQADVENNWSQFKTKHHKSYKNSTHESRRKKIFQNSLKLINDHNQKYNDGQLTYTLGVNEFADWTSDEFMNYVNRGLKSPNPSIEPVNVSPLKSTARASLPTSVDWRSTLNIPIRDQGSCGSCWAFSAVFEIESYNLIKNSQSTDLSEQNLVDCTYSTDGCQGGWMADAYNYVKTNNGINTESGYPYQSASSGTWTKSCKYSSSNVGAQVTGYVSLPSGNETALVEALANVGPLAVALYVSSSFQYYSSGVFNDTTCNGKGVNHAVNLVGYGVDSTTNQPYYILRNQWGTSWGTNGYMLFARNNNNQCMIASYASYPIVKSTGTVTTTTTPAITTTTTSKPTTASSIPTTTTQKQTTTINSVTTTPVKASSTTQKQTTTTIPLPTTTSKPVTTTTSYKQNLTNTLCSNGTGYYAYPGCKTFYYCSRTITEYYCPTGYLFDYASQSCYPSSNVICNPPTVLCPNGTAFYPRVGCQNVYYCQQSIYNYTAPTGYLFNPTKISYVSASTYKCPV